MVFDRLLERVCQRITAYRRSCQPDIVLSEGALAEAAELWQAAQPANPEHRTSEDGQRLAAARNALGWLHFLRSTALPTVPQHLSELARAIDYLAPLAHHPGTIPEPLQALLGTAADADHEANVAADLLRQVATMNDPALLNAAIWLLTASMTATPHNHPDRAGRLSDCGHAYRVRFERGGALSDLAQAIEIGEQAVDATSHGHPNRAVRLSNLGLAYLARFERGGALSDLDLAIETIGKAVDIPNDHPFRAAIMSNLGHACLRRFERSGALGDLSQAIAFTWQAVDATPHNHPDRAAMLSNLGNAHIQRYGRSGTLSDLEHAVESYEQAVTATLEGHPDRAKWLFNLGRSYRVRFERGGTPTDLDQAIKIGGQAAAAAPHNHPFRAAMVSNLGLAYRMRFERGGALADLDQAINLGMQAIDATLHDHPNRAGAMSNCCDAYRVRFERGGALADLDQAIKLGMQAIDATPHDHPNRATMLSNLGIAYLRRFERGGAPADLEHAVGNSEQTVDATPEDHPDRAKWLSNLGIAYLRRFERGGALADLEHAVESYEHAVAATPQGHPDRAKWLFNLGTAYLRRYERGGVLADLDQAIETGRQAVDATPRNHPNRAAILSSLGLAYRVRFERSGVLADVDRAIEIGRQAVNTPSDKHPDRAMYLSGLCLAYLRRFERDGALADADQAIETGRQAVDVTPRDHSNRAAYLSNFGLAYQARFERNGMLADLEHAIENYERAVAATPDDHSDRAKWLFNLGNTYQARLQVAGQGIDPQTVLTLARQVTAAGATAPPVQWVRAAQVVGSLAHAANEHGIAVKLLDAAVSMLPSVPPREAGWADQEHRLGEHFGLVGETVAAHCAINDPVGAVEAAELGRGILLAAQLDSRSDLTDLDHAHHDLATEFRRVRDQLNTPPAGEAEPNPPIDSVGWIEYRKRLWAEHDQLLAQIRQQPGFDRFHLPPRLVDLQPAAAGGAVVLVNSGRRRGDAIIVTAEDDPVHVPLPGVTIADVALRAVAWLEAIHDNSPAGILRRQRMVPETLGWLWDIIVEPALNAVPRTADGTSKLRRVWWLPTGLLGLFPLHAAGHLGHPGALDAVISSYTPTLRTLAHARTRPPATVRRQLTVALHRTPGLPKLPGTLSEATTLHAHQPDTTLLFNEAATTTRVLAALPEATWAHFACHARADLTTPSQGGFALHDAILALPEISRLELGHAELAYLSACSTADRGLQLADEVLHLASAFHMAGFRHVIASLWPLSDHIAATAAAAVYRHLPATPTADHAPTALHHVICELRAKYAERPDLWAALIHSGP